MAKTVMIHPGDRPIITAIITDIESGDPANPTTLSFHVKDPNGVITEYDMGVSSNVTNPDTGVYKLKLPIPYEKTSVGMWGVDVQAFDLLGESVQVEPIELPVQAAKGL